MSATGSDDNSEDHEEFDSDGNYRDIPLKFEDNELVCAATAGLVEEVDFLIGSRKRACENYRASTGCWANIEAEDKQGWAGDNHGWTAVFFAAGKGHIEAVKALLTAGAAVNFPSEFHGSPLCEAASGGHMKIIELLVAAGASLVDRSPLSPRCAAASRGHVEVVAYFLEAGTPVTSPSGMQNYDLLQAAEKGHVGVVELLVAAGASITTPCENRFSALNHAAEKGHAAVVASLLELGAPVDGFPEFVGISGGFGDQDTPLIEAAKGGHLETVKLLLEAGADTYSAPKFGMASTALGHASEEGHVEVVRALIKAGAIVDSEEGIPLPLSGRPLTRAVFAQHLDVVQEILKAGADPDGGRYTFERQSDGSMIKTGQSRTPLMNAASDGKLDIMRILLEAGADAKFVTICGEESYTALMMGAGAPQSSEVVRMLLEAGADPFVRRYNRVRRSQYCGEEDEEWDEYQGMRVTALDFAKEDATKELLKREMHRCMAAALSIVPAKVPLHVRQELMWLAYWWKPAFMDSNSDYSGGESDCESEGDAQNFYWM